MPGRIKLPAPEGIRRHIVTPTSSPSWPPRSVPDMAPWSGWAGCSGCARGECAGLRVGRIDFAGRRLMVVEQATRVAHGRIEFGPPKSTAGRRTLSLSAPTVGILAQHLVWRELTAADREELVFVAPEGGVIDYGHWRQRVWLPACATTGLTGLTFHDLRRANATALVAEGVDIKTAQVRLGHSDPRLTLDVYAQATTEGDRQAADRVTARMMAPTAPSTGGQDSQESQENVSRPGTRLTV